MTDRVVANLILTTAIALGAMGWCLTRTTGATVIGRPPQRAAVNADSLKRRAEPLADPTRAAADPAFAPVPGTEAGEIRIVPEAHPAALAMAAELLDRERAFAEPRQWTLRVVLPGAYHPSDTSHAVARIGIVTDVRAAAGSVGEASIHGGRAAPPWLRRALRVAADAADVSFVPETGFRELAARAGVGCEFDLGHGAGPAIALRVGVADERNMAAAYEAALPTLLAMVEQLQEELAVPPAGPDQFAVAPGRYLGAGATGWLWIFPLLPLTLATAFRYRVLVTQEMFTPPLFRTLRRLVWWGVPPLGAGALLLALPPETCAPAPVLTAVTWCAAVGALVWFARRRYRAVPMEPMDVLLGGALMLDLVWSTYLVAAMIRPWGAGAWLASAVLLWPWVAPASGARRPLVAVGWAAGLAPAGYWLWLLSQGADNRPLYVLGWLAASAEPWAVVFGCFVVTAAAYLAWWGWIVPLRNFPVGYAGAASHEE